MTQSTQPLPRKETDPWLVHTLTSHSEKLNGLTSEVKKINGCLRDEISRSRLADSVHDQLIDRQKERLEEHKKNNPGNSNTKDTVTFKWILEKLALPVVMLIVGGVIAILFGA